MFQELSDKFDGIFQRLKGHGKVTEKHLDETLREVRRALLEADVNYKVAKAFTDTVKEKALGQQVLTAISPGQLLVKITHDELKQLMGGSRADIQLQANPTIILMSGLQGSGKTTFSGKLAHFLKHKRGKKPLLVAADVYRPAAIDQLHVLGTQLEIDVYSNRDEKNPIAIAQSAIKQAREQGHTVVIIDTAGRLAVDEQMMQEIEGIKQAIKPHEILFVVDSMTGQDAVNTAKAFNARLDFSGVVLTKLDGDTRGGAALSIRSVVEKPIKFIGTGEKMDALDIFYPERMADRILGMGDVVSLVEKAQEQFNQEEARKLSKKIATNKFYFNDFLQQLHQIKKMGNIKDLMGMIPGMGKAMKDMPVDDSALKGVEAIILSMTPKERSNPDIINGSRRQRIAKGSGQTLPEVNRLMKQFEDTRKMMRMMQDKNAMTRMMRQMPKMP